MTPYAGGVDSAHDRFEMLAVGHVLGGLDASDADDFVGHLERCGACRRRVAELRGIADDLAAAERDERDRASLRTRVRAEVDDADPSLPRVPARRLGVLVLVGLLTLGVLGFWNLHLRTQVTALTGVLERADTTLATLADGVALDAELGSGIRGTVATDDERVAVALAGVPTLDDDEVLIVWRRGGQDGDEAVLVTQPDDGRLTASLQVDDATEVLVTRQRLAVGDPTPGGTDLARATL